MVGYKDYRSTPIGGNFSVPDSCCFEYYEGCGYQIFHKSDVEIANIIFTHGCLTLLKDQVGAPALVNKSMAHCNESRVISRFNSFLTKVATFQLLHEVVPIMISYALVGAISAVVELASVALASAYVAQISRRRLREKQQSWVSRNALETQVKPFFTDF